MKSFGGPVLFLDRSDINTDEIIPAKYLTEVSKDALREHVLEDLSLDGFDAARDVRAAQVIVTRDNFGCGSSREHAPWALEVNDINVVVAQGFARIFRQNMFNCGMLALEVPAETIGALFTHYAGADTETSVDLSTSSLTVRGGSSEQVVPFALSEFDRALVEAGGWVEYADAHY